MDNVAVNPAKDSRRKRRFKRKREKNEFIKKETLSHPGLLPQGNRGSSSAKELGTFP